MTGQISLNPGEVKSIYNKSKALIQDVRDQLIQLNSEITALPDRGEWKGDAADTFMGIYGDMQNKITVDFPEVLDALAENLDTRVQKIINADQSGS